MIKKIVTKDIKMIKEIIRETNRVLPHIDARLGTLLDNIKASNNYNKAHGKISDCFSADEIRYSRLLDHRKDVINQAKSYWKDYEKYKQYPEI